MNLYLGIDFGAENIYVSYITEGGKEGYVKFGDKESIKNKYATNGEEDYFGDEAIAKKRTEGFTYTERYKQKLTSEDDKEKYYSNVLEKFLTHIHTKSIAYLKQMRVIDENYTLKRAVITVPIGWEHDYKLREIYATAMKKAGFVHFRLVAEPIAATAEIITVLKKNYKSMIPGEHEYMMVLDMGASTADISFIRNSIPLTPIKGFSSFHSGDYLDCMIASKISGESVENIYSNQTTNLNLRLLLTNANIFKETLSNPDFYYTFEQYGGSIQNRQITKDDLEEITKTLADLIYELIVNSIKSKKIPKVHSMIICGGMSKFKSLGFNQILLEKLKQGQPEIFSDFKNLYNDIKSINESLFQIAIAGGAAILAKDPEFITETLDYSILIEISPFKHPNRKIENKPIILTVVPKHTKISDKPEKFEVLNLYRKFRESNEAILSYNPSDSPFKVLFEIEQGNTMDSSLHINREGEWREIRKCDFVFYIDENGILNIELYEILESGREMRGKGHLELNIKLNQTGVIGT